jgi:ferric-dicitrate binding protein FerR (iron transport regulator)
VALYGSAALIVAAGAAVVMARAHHHPIVQPSNARHFATVAGQLAFAVLDDGTRVTLAPRSRLDIGTGFGTGHRTVTLDGEAYFNVASQTGAPFIVRTSQSDVRVLGTHFDVRAYASSTTVAVLTGKVALTGRHAAAQHLVMTANQVGTVGMDGKVQLRRGDMAQYTDWMKGQLVFRDTPLADVLERLSRWYGVPLSVDDPVLARKTVFADWHDRSLHSVLHMIADALGARVVQHGDHITLVAR